LEDDSFRILGAHIVGPEASILIQEVINLMYTPEGVIFPLSSGSTSIRPSAKWWNARRWLSTRLRSMTRR
ncbi:MAG: hypothetical protein ACLFTV_13275, partial [Desulfococcaceae bacterium]